MSAFGCGPFFENKAVVVAFVPGQQLTNIRDAFMKSCSLLLCFLLFGSVVEAGDKLPTKEQVIKAIAVFRQDPTSDLAKAARSVVVNFSSPDILIVISPKNFPLSDLPTTEEPQLTLLAAFIVGNVDSQLTSGSKARDDAYAGDLQMIRTYRQLQQKNRKLKIPAIEKLAELESRGQLKTYLRTK